MLRRAATPDYEQQAAYHEQLAEAIDRRQRETAKLRTITLVPNL
jgi:hypothetical protein